MTGCVLEQIVSFNFLNRFKLCFCSTNLLGALEINGNICTIFIFLFDYNLDTKLEEGYHLIDTIRRWIPGTCLSAEH